MMANVIDNFLPDEEFRKLKAIVMGLGMPWYYSPSITTRNLSDDKNFYMSHIFYSKNKFSDMFSFITPLTDPRCTPAQHVLTQVFVLI